jgi:biopolymer transport protein ExbD
MGMATRDWQREDHRTPLRITADMNVTPLVDVLLVLLVIFMAALPLVQQGVNVDLPEPAPAQSPPPVDAIVLELGSDRHVTINHTDVQAAELVMRLKEIFRRRADKTLFISAAASLRYRDIVHVIDAAKGAGVERVGIITQTMRERAQ